MMFDYEKEVGFFDNALPFERDIYMEMLLNKLQRKQEVGNPNQAPPRKEEFE